MVAGRAVPSELTMPSELDDHLSGVVAAQDPEERLEVVLDALDDGLPVLQLARADPGADLLDELRLQVVVVADQEALDAAAGLDEAGEVAGAGRGLGVVVDGDRPADGDPAVPVEGADGRLQVVAADVVEVDVDPVRGGLPQLVADLAVLVVEGGVEAVLLHEEFDLLVGAGGADDPRGALEL